MNEHMSNAVKEAFCTFREKGIIYRANRLVNYCVFLKTTLSNIEVDQKELTGRTCLPVVGYEPSEKFEFGVLTSFSYKIEGSGLNLHQVERDETNAEYRRGYHRGHDATRNNAWGCCYCCTSGR